MTKTISNDPTPIRYALIAAQAELDAAKTDVALLERLSSALERAKRLTATITNFTSDLAKAEAAAEKAANETRFDGLSDIRVTEKECGQGGGVLRSSFTVFYTRDAWDMDAQANIPTDVSQSLTALPDNALSFLIIRHPDRIPASIMSLAPGDPVGALARYFQGLRRGYLSND